MTAHSRYQPWKFSGPRLSGVARVIAAKYPSTGIELGCLSTWVLEYFGTLVHWYIGTLVFRKYLGTYSSQALM